MKQICKDLSHAIVEFAYGEKLGATTKKDLDNHVFNCDHCSQLLDYHANVARRDFDRIVELAEKGIEELCFVK